MTNKKNRVGRSARILQQSITLLGSVLVALLIFEGVVRLFFEEPILPRYVIDPGYGVRAHQPNIVTRHSVPGDYVVDITTNSVGMRGQRDYSVDKSRGKKSVLFGCS